MFLSLFATVIVVVVIIIRSIIAKKPVYIYKSKFLDDRPVEALGLLLIMVSFATYIINIFFANKNYSINTILINIGVFISLGLIILVEYNRYKVGIYENGILYRSIFYKWKKIYSYRSKKLGRDKYNIIFYIYDTNDDKKLNKFSVNMTEKENEEVIKAIGENLDPTRS